MDLEISISLVANHDLWETSPFFFFISPTHCQGKYGRLRNIRSLFNNYIDFPLADPRSRGVAWMTPLGYHVCWLWLGPPQLPISAVTCLLHFLYFYFSKALRIVSYLTGNRSHLNTLIRCLNMQVFSRVLWLSASTSKFKWLPPPPMPT